MTGQPLSVAQAAERAGVSAKTIRRAYEAGHLRVERPGNRRRVVVYTDALEEWIQRGRDRAERPPPRPKPPRPAPPRSRRAPVRGSRDALRAIERGAT